MASRSFCSSSGCSEWITVWAFACEDDTLFTSGKALRTASLTMRVVTSLLFIWRGIQDLRDRSGTAWKTEDERKNFRKFSGVTLILGGTAFLFNTILPDIEPWNIILLVAAYLACIGFVISNLCYHGSRDDKDKK